MAHAVDVELEIRVRYHEVDQMGFVYHPRFLSWFEMARMELLRGLGHPYDRTEASGLRFPLIRMETDFRRPLRFDDWMRLQSWLLEHSGARFSLAYRILVGDELRAEGRTDHAVLSAATGKPTRLPAELAEAFRRLPSQGGPLATMRARDPSRAELEG